MEQKELFVSRRGGARAGSGRKRVADLPRVEHRARPAHVARHPLHVTLRVVDGLPSLREEAARPVLRAALHAASERLGLRVVHVSVQTNHVHLLCEAEDQDALSRGMKGLMVRVARALNRLWQRSGAVFADRYHARPLETPREVKSVLAYLFFNARKHGARFAQVLDPHSSAVTFDGWKEHGPLARPWLARARTWLLTIGWRKHGLLSVLRA